MVAKKVSKKNVKKIQDDVMESARKVWLAGLGALAAGQEKGSELFDELVRKGEALESAGKEQVEKAKETAVGTVTGVKAVAESYWETFEKKIDERLTGVIHTLGVPTKDEIETLTKKVEELTQTIEKLQKKEAPARKPAARKPAAKKTAATKTAAK